MKARKQHCAPRRPLSDAETPHPAGDMPISLAEVASADMDAGRGGQSLLLKADGYSQTESLYSGEIDDDLELASRI